MTVQRVVDGLFRQESVWDIASKLDVSLPGKRRLVAPSALVQARQRLGVAPCLAR